MESSLAVEAATSEDVHHNHNHSHHYQHHHDSHDIELIGGDQRVPHSGPLNKRVGRRSSKLNTSSATDAVVVGGNSSIISHQQQQDEGDYVEVTMDIQGGSVALHSVKDAGGNDLGEDEKLVLLGKGMEKKRSFGATVVRNASIRMKQVSQELKRLASFSAQPAASRVAGSDRTKAAVSHALKGLKFISNKTGGDGGGDAGWSQVEKQFEILTASTGGYLHRSLFAKCIGMNKESEAFAGELFDSLARRRNIHGDSINKAQLKDFWDQISDQSFDSRLRTFFDM